MYSKRYQSFLNYPKIYPNWYYLNQEYLFPSIYSSVDSSRYYGSLINLYYGRFGNHYNSYLEQYNLAKSSVSQNRKNVMNHKLVTENQSNYQTTNVINENNDTRLKKIECSNHNKEISELTNSKDNLKKNLRISQYEEKNQITELPEIKIKKRNK
jgi:hypothetical protein